MNCLPPQTQSDLEIQRTCLFLPYHPPLSPLTAERNSPPPSLISHPPRPVQSLYLSTLPSTPITPPLLSPKTHPTTNPIRTLTHTPGRPSCCERSGIAVCVGGVFVSGLGGVGEWISERESLYLSTSPPLHSTTPPLLSPKTHPTINLIRTLTHAPGRPSCCERSGIAVWGVFVSGLGGGVDK